MRRVLLTLTAFLLLCVPAHASWTWPVRGEVITPYRNGNDPYAAGQHRGIDIAAAVGAPVVAAAAGEVRFAGTAGSSGLTVSVRTGDGFDTSYLHLSSLAVRAGARVAAGERVGAVGTTGSRSAAQSHLHFGVREAGTQHAYIDPLSMLPPAPTPPPSEEPRPVPAPAPLGPDPAPEPAPAPRGAPTPRRAPVPRFAPSPRLAPAPRLAPRTAPAPAPSPHGAPALRLAPSPRSAPAPRLAPRTAPAPTVSPQRAAASRTAPASVPPPAPRTTPAPGPQPSPPVNASSSAANDARQAPPAPGPDIGWALACAGLLLAAGVLGLSDDGRRATARGRTRVEGLLRPLLGRR